MGNGGDVGVGKMEELEVEGEGEGDGCAVAAQEREEKEKLYNALEFIGYKDTPHIFTIWLGGA